MSNPSAPWANLDDPALDLLRLNLSHQLHKRWLKATRDVVEDHTYCAATDAILVTASAFLFSTLEHIPAPAHQTWLQGLRQRSERVPPLPAQPGDLRDLDHTSLRRAAFGGVEHALFHVARLQPLSD